MIGNPKIINSKKDLELSGVTAEQLTEMARITVRYDDAVYPDGYDRMLTHGDDGYIEPVYRYEEEVDQVILKRFGVQQN